jgi:hypothetical protein
LNFVKSWTPLNDARMPDAKVFWEFVNGAPTFKFGPTGETSDEVKRSVRGMLRELVLAGARDRGMDFRAFGRTGAHMSIARASTNLRSFWRNGVLEAEAVRKVIDVCWAIHADVVNSWQRRTQ